MLVILKDFKKFLRFFSVIPRLGGCVAITLKWNIVILNEVKNLIKSSSYKTEILRLEPQNDIVTQPLDRGIQRKSGFGACPVLDTGVKPENDNHWNRVHYE
jgi:hypothetical protein